MEAALSARPTPSLTPDLPELNSECPSCRALLILLQAQAAQFDALTAWIEQLEVRLNQNSGNSSRPPSSDGPAAPKPKPREKPSRRRRGGQPGHRGSQRDLKPLEMVSEVVEELPT